MKHGSFFRPHKWKHFGYGGLLKVCVECGLAQQYTMQTRWRDLTYEEFLVLFEKAKKREEDQVKWRLEAIKRKRQIEKDKHLILRTIKQGRERKVEIMKKA